MLVITKKKNKKNRNIDGDQLLIYLWLFQSQIAFAKNRDVQRVDKPNYVVGSRTTPANLGMVEELNNRGQLVMP